MPFDELPDIIRRNLDEPITLEHRLALF